MFDISKRKVLGFSVTPLVGLKLQHQQCENQWVTLVLVGALEMHAVKMNNIHFETDCY